MKNGKQKPEPTNFMEAVKQHQKEAGCTEAEAIRFCADKYPDLCKELQNWAELIQKPKTFMEAVKRRIKETGCTEKQAIGFCAPQYPALYEEMRKGAKQD